MSITSFAVTETGMEEEYLAISEMVVANVKWYFPKDTENIFFELLLPNTKPIVVGKI